MNVRQRGRGNKILACPLEETKTKTQTKLQWTCSKKIKTKCVSNNKAETKAVTQKINKTQNKGKQFAGD
jgi:hypothetical protein